MTADERIDSLEKQLKQALEQLAAANKRIKELEKQKMAPPAFANANVKKPKAGFYSIPLASSSPSGSSLASIASCRFMSGCQLFTLDIFSQRYYNLL